MKWLIPILCGCLLSSALVWADPQHEVLPYATISNECAPWDGPALRLVLQKGPQTPYPQLSIGIWTVPPAVNSWIQMTQVSQQVGSALWCTAEATCKPIAVDIRFDQITPAGDAAGRWRYPGDSREMPFHAKYHSVRMFCG